MYHPSRGGVRGGTDQFTWDSVKTDKHRENYLGHSVMAPVGRWQKGKDLSWYAKERKSGDNAQKSKNEKLAVKKAEEEAMMIALGFKEAKKEGKTLVKEEIAEVLKRNQGDRVDLSIERIGGLGVESGRMSMGIGGRNKKNNDGVTFETVKVGEKRSRNQDDGRENSKSSSQKKSSKKHKKEKKRESKRAKTSSSSKKNYEKLSSNSQHSDSVDEDTYHKQTYENSKNSLKHSYLEKQNYSDSKYTKRNRKEYSSDSISDNEDDNRMRSGQQHVQKSSRSSEKLKRSSKSACNRRKRHDTSSSESD